MIVRKEDYKIDEAAYLLDLPARTIIALCDADVIACSRLVANGALKQRKRRHVGHCEIVRFNQTRTATKRTNLAERLVDPNAEQATLPFTTPQDDPGPDGESALWLSKFEWRHVVAAVQALSDKSEGLKSVVAKIGPAGIEVINRGIRVHTTEDAA